MISYPHRNNSDFQLEYFMCGSCHTADGRWALMYAQKIDIENKIEHCRAQNLRREAKIADAEAVLRNRRSGKGDRLRAQADLIEAHSAGDVPELNYLAAQNELATINRLMAEVEPYRKYKHLPMLEANEKAQRDEWLGELITRAEDYLVTMGTIPQDHYNAMRRHPDFITHIGPHIRETWRAVQANGGNRFSLLKKQEPLFIERRKEAA